MSFLLDSDVLSDLYEPSSPGHSALARRFSALADTDRVFVSILALFEWEFAAAKAPDDMRTVIWQRISTLKSDFEILSLSEGAARHFGRLKKRLSETRGLSKNGSKVHNIDLMIAATALQEGCTLISADSIYPELCRLEPELRLENWLAEA